jgi:hypothetical protein
MGATAYSPTAQLIQPERGDQVRRWSSVELFCREEAQKSEGE